MTITYTWAITGLECADPDSDVDCDSIKSASWSLTGNDGTNQSSIASKTSLDIAMTPGEGQTVSDVFALVTEADIIAAIHAVMGTDTINNMKANIANNLTIQAMPVPVLITTTLPWVV
jgi:hypothetical protein